MTHTKGLEHALPQLCGLLLQVLGLRNALLLVGVGLLGKQRPLTCRSVTDATELGLLRQRALANTA